MEEDEKWDLNSEEGKALIAAIMHNQNESYEMARAIASVHLKEWPIPELRNKKYDHLYLDLEQSTWAIAAEYGSNDIIFYQRLAQKICKLISNEYQPEQKYVYEKYCNHLSGKILNADDFAELEKTLYKYACVQQNRADLINDTLIAFDAALRPDEYLDDQNYNEMSIAHSPRELSINPDEIYKILEDIKTQIPPER